MDATIINTLNAAFPGSGALIDSVSSLFGGKADASPSAQEVMSQLQPLQPDDRLKAMYGIILTKPDVWNGSDSKAARFNQYIELFGKSTAGMTLDTVTKWNALVNAYGEQKDLLNTIGLTNSIGNVSNVSQSLFDVFGNVSANSLFGNISNVNGVKKWKPSLLLFILLITVISSFAYVFLGKKKNSLYKK